MHDDIKSQIKFGTDGWRGVISDNFTFANVRIVAQATAEWIKNELKVPAPAGGHVAIGYDTRFMSGDFAELVACVLAANGITVYLSDTPIPTPALSYGVVQIKGCCGIMITASHNPGKFNGIKIKTYQGGGASKDITDRVESHLGKTPVQDTTLAAAKSAGKIIIHDFKPVYLKFMRNYIDLKKIKSAKFKVLTDVMHGSGQRQAGMRARHCR